MSNDRFLNHASERRDVDQSAGLLKRLYLAERETMRALGAWHISIATWDLKIATPRHLWQDSLHADAYRNRILELRYPRRDVDKDHDPALVRFLAELTRAPDETAFARGIYEVVKPALIAAGEEYVAGGDALIDAPSMHHIAHVLLDERRHLEEIAAPLAALPSSPDADGWVEYLETALASLGGLLGQHTTGPWLDDHAFANRADYVVPERAVRDPRFAPAVVESPGRPPVSVRERQVWYAIDHANEVWAAEVPGAFMWEFPEMPWAFYLDLARWSYDEMRHALMGVRRLDAWGFELGQDYPMVGDPIHAIRERGGGPLEILALLYYFERDAPAHRVVVKREFLEMEDTDTAHDTDYDWADEAIHLRYGFTWLQHLLGPEARTELPTLVERAGTMWNEWIAERWDRDEHGYEPFMQRIDARISEAERAQAVPETAR